jgi:hypothetical protein
MSGRFKAVWYVLTGRPVMFRMKVRDGVLGYDASRGALFLDCSLIGMDLRQRGGNRPSAASVRGVRCASHHVGVRQDDAGNLICPMDGQMILAVDFGDGEQR